MARKPLSASAFSPPLPKNELHDLDAFKNILPHLLGQKKFLLIGELQEHFQER